MTNKNLDTRISADFFLALSMSPSLRVLKEVNYGFAAQHIQEGQERHVSESQPVRPLEAANTKSRNAPITLSAILAESLRRGCRPMGRVAEESRIQSSLLELRSTRERNSDCISGSTRRKLDTRHPYRK